MADDDYDPFEDPTMFGAPIFPYDTAEDILRKLMDEGWIDEFRVEHPKVKETNYLLRGLTSAHGIRLGDSNKAGKRRPWFTVHVESLPAETFAGLMEGNPNSELLLRAVDKITDPNVFALLGDNRHWVMWIERDGSRELNPELSLGPRILPLVITKSLNDGDVLWTREPRYSSAASIMADIRRVPGMWFESPAERDPDFETFTTTADFTWPEALGFALESNLRIRKGVSCEIEVLIEQSYRNDIAMRLASRYFSKGASAYVDGNGWGVRITVTSDSDGWYDVNEAELVASHVASVLDGTVWVPN